MLLVIVIFKWNMFSSFIALFLLVNGLFDWSEYVIQARYSDLEKIMESTRTKVWPRHLDLLYSILPRSRLRVSK